MDNFNIGDNVVYNPNIKNLAPPDKRPWDHYIVQGKLFGSHLQLYKYFDNKYSTSIIRYDSVTLLSKTIDIEIKTDFNYVEIKAGSYDPITFEEFKHNDIIIDFLRNDSHYESEFNTYYSNNTFIHLIKNPFTLKVIDKSKAIYYRVKII
jgi:hypothetical protein